MKLLFTFLVSLILTDADIASIRKQINEGTNEPLTLIHNTIMSEADMMLEAAPVEYKKDASGKRILSVSRTASQRMSYCAYAYRYSGDRAYFNKALQTVHTVCDFPNWNSKHYLDVGEMCVGVALVYDWLYDELPVDTRLLIEEKLKEYAFDTMDETNHENIWEQMNNRNQVNLAGLLCAAMAVRNVYPEFAESLVKRVVESNSKVVDFIYNPDGAYPEGPGYWSYGTSYQVLLNTILAENCGSDYGLGSIPGFVKTPWFEVFSSGSSGKVFNFSDCRPDDIPHYPLWYFAYTSGDPSILYSELNYLRNHNYADSQQRSLMVLALKYAAKIDASRIQPSGQKLYVAKDGAIPVAIARSGWDEEDQWMALKGGKANFSHAHMDAGEFLYDAYGVRWSQDVPFYTYATVEKPISKLGGSYWDFSQTSMRWQVSRVNCHWHSCLIFDGKDLKVNGFASITDSFDTPERRGATMDLTPLYDNVSKVTRTVAICDSDYLEVTDAIECSSKGHTVQFNLVSEAEPELTSDGIILSRNGIKVKLQTSGAAVKYKIWPADPIGFNTFSFEETAPDTYICGFTVKLPKNSSTSLVTTLKRID